MKSKHKVSDHAYELLTLEARPRELIPGIGKADQLRWTARGAADHCSLDPLSVITFFKACVFAGVTPPPRLLEPIAEAFADYLSSKGNKDLDRAFGLEPKPKTGHPLVAQTRKVEREKLLHYMWSLRQNAKLERKRMSILKAAGECVNNFNLDEGQDALARDYSRLQIDTTFADLYGAIEEKGLLRGKVDLSQWWTESMRTSVGRAAIKELQAALARSESSRKK